MSTGTLHIITSLDRGGAETMLLRLCKELIRRGERVAVLSLLRSSGLQQGFLDAGVQVFYPSDLWTLKKSLGFTPVIVQGWLPHGNMFSLLVQRLLFQRAKLLWSVRQSLHSWGTSNRWTQMIIRLGARLSRTPDMIVYNSHTGRNHHTRIGYSPSRSTVIANGFEVDHLYAARQDREKARQELRISPEEIAIIHVARFHPAKDHETFLKSVVLVAREYPKVQVVCLGRDVDISNSALAKHIPVDLLPRFHLLGERVDVSRLLAASDIYCSSSIAEAFSNSIGEAMCVGLPCVVTDVGDSRIIVDMLGMVIPARSVQLMARSLSELTRLSSADREEKGRKSHDSIKCRFSIEAIGASYMTMYQSISK